MIELDKRIISGKKPLTCFDAEQAQNFVGKKCYLTNDISIFSDLDSFKETEGCSDAPYVGVIDRLTNINKELGMVFDTTFLRWKFCIPCEWVKEEEKTYRPYKNVQELFGDIGVYIGDPIHFRSKAKGTESYSLITSYTTLKDGTEKICLGGAFYYTMQALFDLFELHSRGEWIPFGKECEE